MIITNNQKISLLFLLTAFSLHSMEEIKQSNEPQEIVAKEQSEDVIIQMEQEKPEKKSCCVCCKLPSFCNKETDTDTPLKDIIQEVNSPKYSYKSYDLLKERIDKRDYHAVQVVVESVPPKNLKKILLKHPEDQPSLVVFADEKANRDGIIRGKKFYIKSILTSMVMIGAGLATLITNQPTVSCNTSFNSTQPLSTTLSALQLISLVVSSGILIKFYSEDKDRAHNDALTTQRILRKKALTLENIGHNQTR